MTDFGNELKKLRKEKKLSLKEVAKKGDLSHSYISQIENGKRNAPKPEIIRKLAKGLNINPSLLMYKAGYIDNSFYHQQLKLSEELEQLEREESHLSGEVIKNLKEDLESLRLENINIIQLIKLQNDIRDAHQFFEKLQSNNKVNSDLEKDYTAIKRFEKELANRKINSINDYTIDVLELTNIDTDLYYDNQLLSKEDKQNITKFIDNFVKR
ncbi:hypothetical protein Pryu01_02431 [Paraliobacillus ryukyuensis]|uniref:Helix-turn-helix protein n=1 Tax=Paraliobacillus ryukyuensis TaxID=200904 RepID=A0A366DU15_9BACI|nr:helix-turn-helix domain-containing protein [Paraliobacillus ryukyuensis]RBO93582.1 helix-turn-helix protein [Paraliobacillus ryukyuensis]